MKCEVSRFYMIPWFHYVASCRHHHPKRVEHLHFWLVLRWLLTSRASSLSALIWLDKPWERSQVVFSLRWVVQWIQRYLLHKSETLYPEKKAVDQQETQHYSLSCSILVVWRAMLSMFGSEGILLSFKVSGNDEVSICRSSDSLPCCGIWTKKTRLLGRSSKTWARRSWVGHSRNALAVSLMHTWVIDVLHHRKYLEGLAGPWVWISWLQKASGLWWLLFFLWVMLEQTRDMPHQHWQHSGCQ